MRYGVSRRKRAFVRWFLILCAAFIFISWLLLNLRSVDEQPLTTTANGAILDLSAQVELRDGFLSSAAGPMKSSPKNCATVEEMGNAFKWTILEESLRVRRIIERHFSINGAPRIRELPPEQFCKHGFVMGKSSEAGFGNEMYKMGKYPFGDYILYSNHTFTLREVKQLWRQNGCVQNYGRHLVMRIDDFEKPAKTNALCSNWRKWQQPIIWYQGTNDAVGAQFFLKNVHPEMRDAASKLFGKPESLQRHPNVFGELMRILISPSREVEEAINWVLGGGRDPDITLHMRMLMNRSIRAAQAALNCLKRATSRLQPGSRPRVVVVSDTPSFVKSIVPNISEFSEVLIFDYELFRGNMSYNTKASTNLDFRLKDWGPAPRWVAFVDFFLASRAKHAVVSGAHRRVGTTYAQLIAALAAANSIGENSTASNFSFLSSFHGNLLTEGLNLQVGWGHVWNRFAGPLSCRGQSNQCAFTPLLPPAWWEGLWQSPIPRDINRLELYGVHLSDNGTIDENLLRSYCSSRKNVVKTFIYI
ncbi:histidine kinase 3-like isoform X1 [Hibiscus syriacus]|uniref:Histidine kinase 3-like isoform X1 n=1 Tax=Hibiscus syriacus TaxID=106335 RepID=A0A6A3BFN0_HIBSY|nr:histidine kinase 3-like isoform X1 [Hibiscus syriacus]